VSLVKSNKLRRSVLVGLALALLGPVCGGPVGAQTSNPLPLINQPLVPDATAPGGPQFTLTVNGTGFVSNSIVNWNGSPLATTFVSGSQLTAVVPAADVATASTGWVTVVNPAPGGGASNMAFFTVTPNIGSSVGFAMEPYPIDGPFSVAVADFNGDGNLDLAVPYCGTNVNCNTGQVAILMGDGKGNFTPTSSSPSVPFPGYVVAGDFNGDGKPDLAVDGGPCVGCISIFLGDGTGNFTLASAPYSGSDWFPAGLAVGDFNGDGHLDLASLTGGFGPNAVLGILIGDGTGNLTLQSTMDVGTGPGSLAVGDFNGDGKLDLAVTNSTSLSIFLGDGSGNFTLSNSLPLTYAGNLIAAGDFNGDGKLDVAIPGGYSETVSIFLGDGTGNFTLASSPGTSNCATTLAAGDFNGDGNLDLAVGSCADYMSTNQLSLLLGDGTGNFSLLPPLATGRYVPSLATGDFNSDGKLDLAVVDVYNKSIDVMLQVPPYPAVTLSPASLGFGTHLIGTSAEQSVTLSNTGMATLNLTSIVASASFSQKNNCGTSVAAGASCTITVTFEARALGVLVGTITITDDASNSPQTVPLSGLSTEVQLAPAGGLYFGNQAVGTTSAPRTVTLENRGHRPLSIAGFHIAGDDPADFAETNACGTSVPPRSSCTISVTFTPQANGFRTATLGVVDNGGVSPQTVSLNGYGK